METQSEHQRVEIEVLRENIRSVNTILTNHAAKIQSLERKVKHLEEMFFGRHIDKRISNNAAEIVHLYQTRIENKKFKEMALDMLELHKNMQTLTGISWWSKLKVRIQRINKK